ncbi:DUF4124 domain-containing protein [Propionivibrio limicola]|uniref:DUF4124 domain-containing protein n=1 Tax=Propionivibrio limicola TaxID=167645 RepID=UPI001FE456F1|nr:DUF4124 domain-containing protein [Propionivibrio limicola]
MIHLLPAALLAAATSANADVMYQCIDESGHKSFSNVKPAGKNVKCTAMNLGDPGTTTPAPKSGAAPKTPTPANFPKVDDTTQKARDNDRRHILESELATEQKNLEQARKELAEQESLRSGNERNYQKVLDRLQPYKDKIALHERNIEAIQKELGKLR